MTEKIPIILDIDPGHDDAVAIMLACGSPKIDLLTVTTVAGNVPLDKTTDNALRILSLIGRTNVLFRRERLLRSNVRFIRRRTSTARPASTGHGYRMQNSKPTNGTRRSCSRT